MPFVKQTIDLCAAVPHAEVKGRVQRLEATIQFPDFQLIEPRGLEVDDSPAAYAGSGGDLGLGKTRALAQQSVGFRDVGPFHVGDHRPGALSRT
jgi:hypothetical protein